MASQALTGDTGGGAVVAQDDTAGAGDLLLKSRRSR